MVNPLNLPCVVSSVKSTRVVIWWNCVIASISRTHRIKSSARRRKLVCAENLNACRESVCREFKKELDLVWERAEISASFLCMMWDLYIMNSKQLYWMKGVSQSDYGKMLALTRVVGCWWLPAKYFNLIGSGGNIHSGFSCFCRLLVEGHMRKRSCGREKVLSRP